MHNFLKICCVQKKKKKKFSAQPTQRNVVPASKICEVKAGRGIMLVFYRLLTHSHTVMHTVSQSGASQAHIYNTHFTQLPATLETPHVFKKKKKGFIKHNRTQCYYQCSKTTCQARRAFVLLQIVTEVGYPHKDPERKMSRDN